MINWQEPHKSIHKPEQIVEFCKATKRGRTNVTGLARALWRTGEEDIQIQQWLERHRQQQQVCIGDIDMSLLHQTKQGWSLIMRCCCCNRKMEQQRESDIGVTYGCECGHQCLV